MHKLTALLRLIVAGTDRQPSICRRSDVAGSCSFPPQTCHIGDGDHMLEHGIISHVNRAAAALGCSPGQSVRECAEVMRAAIVPATAPPSIIEGARFVIRDVPGEPMVICANSVGMLQPEDAGRIAITASHGALSGGRPDNAIPPGIYAVFFSDAGGGMDGAGIARLADLDQKGIVAGTTSADSAPMAIHARSTATVSCRMSTEQQSGSGAGLACRWRNSSIF